MHTTLPVYIFTYILYTHTHPTHAPLCPVLSPQRNTTKKHTKKQHIPKTTLTLVFLRFVFDKELCYMSDDAG